MKTEANGIEIGYDVQGDGPWLVLCHSLGLDRSMWSRQVAAFARSHRVLTWDARGHGETTSTPGPYDFHLMALDLAALMDSLGIRRSAVLGISMGGALGITFATDYPARTSALVLSDTTAWYGPDAKKNWGGRIAAVRSEGITPDVLEAQAGRWFTDAFRMAEPEYVHTTLELLRNTDLQGYLAVMEALSNMDLRPELGKIGCPTLIVVGAGDPATPRSMAEDLNRAVGGSSLVVLDRARHLAPIERAEEFNRAVLQFLSGVGA